VRRVLLRIFSTAASSAFCALPVAAHESPVPHDHLPPVNITAPDTAPPKRVAKPKPSQHRGTRSRTVVRPEQPQPAPAGSGGVTPAASSEGAGALQPTAASAIRFTGAEVNAVPFTRPGEALGIVPGLIVTQHSGEGKANQYFLRGFNLDHGTDLAITVDGMPVNMPTHGHGQGYADINFLIPELIRSVMSARGRTTPTSATSAPPARSGSTTSTSCQRTSRK
jgi:TonB-dependent receptor-like protein